MIISEILLITLLVSTPFSQVIAIIGSRTPPEFISLLSDTTDSPWLSFGAGSVLLTTPFTAVELITSRLGDAKAVFDATFSSLETESLAGLCSEFEIPQLVFGYVSSDKFHKWTFYVNGRQSEVATELAAVLDYFGWTKVNLVSDSNPQLHRIDEFLQSSQRKTYQKIDISRTDDESIARTVGKVMRMSGNRVSVFLTLSDVTAKVLIAQYEKNIGEAGFANVMPLVSSLIDHPRKLVPSIDTGNLILAEEELSSAASQSHYYELMLTRASELCANYTDNAAMLHALDRRFPAHYREGAFRLISMQEGRRVPVGWVYDSNVTVYGTIYFLGNSTVVPTNTKSPLQISANFGYGNVEYLEVSVRYYYNGGMLAIDYVNNSPTILENFYLDLMNFTAGVTEWNYQYAYSNVYPYRDKLGVAVLAGISSGVTMKLIGLLHDLGYDGSVVGSSTTVNSLSSHKDFPTFIRTILPDSYITRVYVQMFKRFNWKNCGLFVSNETWGLGFQKDFTKLALENGIEILNDALLQVLPTPIMNETDLAPYEANLINFINTKARILIIVVNVNAIAVVDYLYDLGLRGGDLQIVADEWMSFGYVMTDNPDLNMKRRQLLKGAIQFSPIGFVGKFGVTVEKEYELAYGEVPSVYSCFFYDSALAVAYALDLIVHLGNDYMDKATVLRYLRGSRFVGCTGIVTFDPDTNDRSSMPYDVLNARFDENDSDILTIGRYDPTSTVLFRFDSDIIWCDGTTVVPSDMRKSTINCPFEDKFNQDFPKGRKTLYGIAAIIAGITIVPLLIGWILWSKRRIVVITEAREIQMQDAIYMIGVAIELIQYISVGPDLSFLLLPTLKLISGSTLTMEDFISLKNGGFTQLWELIIATVLLWLCMCTVTFFRLDVRLKWLPGCPSFGELSEFLIPLVGNFLFIPIISILIDVFVCTEAIGLSPDVVSYTDSYLHKDCYLLCWQGKHSLYALGSSAGLAVFIPAVILLRPLWQEKELALSVKSSTVALLVKSGVQVAFVLVKKAVSNAVAHCCAFIGITLAFTAFSVKHTGFTYQRTSFWHRLSLLALLWSSILALIELLIDSAGSIVYLGLVVSGWGLIALFGAVYQKLKIPSLLYRRPGVDPSVLFRFAFQRATTSLVGELNDSLKRVGSRCTITQTKSRYAAEESEEWGGRRNLVENSRIHVVASSGKQLDS